MLFHVSKTPEFQQGILEPQQLEPYFDISKPLVDAVTSVYPVMSYPINGAYTVGCELGTYIPIGDHEGYERGALMGAVVAKSHAQQQTYLVKNVPMAQTTPLPTRILMPRGSDIIYPPIHGFVLLRQLGRVTNLDVALVVGQDEQDLSIQHLGALRGKQYVARQLNKIVSKAIALGDYDE